MKKFLNILLVLIFCAPGLALEKSLTVKGYLGLGSSSFSWNAAHNNYDGSHHRYEENWHNGLSNAYGLGAEYAILKNKRQEILLGGYYLLPQKIKDSSIKARIKGMTNDSESFDVEFDNENTIQQTSLYIKPRVFLAEPTKDNPVLVFLAAKFSYNLIDLQGDLADVLEAYDRNAFGYGFSFGTVIEDTWEFELTYDALINSRIEAPGVIILAENDYTPLTGIYNLKQILFSVGYRL